MVEKGVNIVTEDVTELSAAIVEDTQASYSAISTATFDTITKVLYLNFKKYFQIFQIVI